MKKEVVKTQDDVDIKPFNLTKEELDWITSYIFWGGTPSQDRLETIWKRENIRMWKN